ncbi:hypothetical protein DFJ74DRAFT_681313 [Hyaloraphidium curvatum]|nr:hypothetical protein DFJ74DRAFT_681313 [Hyaloraphidium curvatum]
MLSHLEPDEDGAKTAVQALSPFSPRSHKRKAPAVAAIDDVASPAKKAKPPADGASRQGSFSPATPRRARDQVSQSSPVRARSFVDASGFFSSPPGKAKGRDLSLPDLDQRKLELLEARLLGRKAGTTPSAVFSPPRSTRSGDRGSRSAFRTRDLSGPGDGLFNVASPQSSQASSPSATPRSRRSQASVARSGRASNDALAVAPLPSGVAPRPLPALSPRTKGGGPDDSFEEETEDEDDEDEVEEMVTFEGDADDHRTTKTPADRESQASPNGNRIVLQMTDSMIHSQVGPDRSPTHSGAVHVSSQGSPVRSHAEDAHPFQFRSLLDGEFYSPPPGSHPPVAAPSKPAPGTGTGEKKRIRKFTEAEDQLLTGGVARHGTDWEEVAKFAFPGGDRTAEQVKSRWKRLTKKKKDEAQGSQLASEATPLASEAVKPLHSSPVAGEVTAPRALADVVDLTSPIKLGGKGHRPYVNSPHEDAVGSGGPSAVNSPTKLGSAAKGHHARPIYEYFSRRDGASMPVPGKGSRFPEREHTVDGSGAREFPDSWRREQEQMKLQAAQLLAKLQEQEKEKASLQNKLDELERQREDLVQRHSSVVREAESKILEAQQNKKAQLERSRTILTELLTTQAREKAREKRRKCNENSLRLASMTVERSGMELQERWEEGYEFQEVEDKISRIAVEKEEIEKRRKLLTKRRNLVPKPAPAADGVFAVPDPPQKDATAKPRKGAGSSRTATEEEPLSLQDFYEQDEILKLRIGTLRKEEAELNAYLAKLQIDRNQHVREMRRIRDENASRFNNNPILCERYLLMELLGRGGFSEVWKAWDLNEMTIVAVKIHSLNSQWSEERKRSYTRHAIREYRIHKSLVHPRIIRLWDVFEIDDTSFATVLDFNDGVDLETYLQTVKTIPEREARSIITQVVSALKYLNELPKPIIHYDLKPGNILLSNGEVRITDFGLSKILEPASTEDGDAGFGGRREFGPREMELTSQGAGTYWYLPPEVFERSRGGPPMISSKVDVWSLGVIFYEILYGEKPFANDKSQQSILRTDTITMEAHSLVFPAKPAVSQETKDFIRRLLEYRKDKRPDVLAIANDPYINVALGKQSTAKSGATL